MSTYFLNTRTDLSYPQNTTALDFVRRDRNVAYLETMRLIEMARPDSESVPLNRTFDLEASSMPLNHTFEFDDLPAQLYPRDDDDDEWHDCVSWMEDSQRDPPWNLQALTAKNRFRGDYEFKYIRGAGKGVNVYIMDSGINIEHSFFKGRAVNMHGVSIPRRPSLIL